MLNKVLSISGFVLTLILLIILIDTMIYFKKNENKLIEEIRPKLLRRIKIVTILMIIISILTITKIIITR